MALGVIASAVVFAACSGSSNEQSTQVTNRVSETAAIDNDMPTLFIAGIPDQNASTLARRYELLTDYLEAELGIDVEYVPTIDYAATVTGFKQDDIQMAWFGGFTGVQARIAVPDSEAIEQRPIDTEFHSKFIVQADLDVGSLKDLKGLTFTFGSESSTSGHVMPRHFLLQAGVDPDKDFKGLPNFSGSHDTTWKLVESGAFQAGVLNESVWEKAVSDGRVDTDKVRVLETTPPYFDYNWTIRGDVDDTYGAGFVERVKMALLRMGRKQPDVLQELFSSPEFIESENGNYNAIKNVAISLGFVE